MENVEELTVSKLVKHGAALADPEGTDPELRALLLAFEDDDRPAAGMTDTLRAELQTTVDAIDPEDDSAPAEIAAAVAVFVAGDPSALHGDRETTLREAVRVAWGGDPPEHVRGFLDAQGVEV
jgi:hypothetical protein